MATAGPGRRARRRPSASGRSREMGVIPFESLLINHPLVAAFAVTFDGRLTNWWTKIVIGALLFFFIAARRWILKSTVFVQKLT
jgi:hypothetical protein